MEEKTYNIALTEKEINHIMASFNMIDTASLSEDDIQLENSINSKLAKALLESKEDTVEIDMPEDFKIEQVDAIKEVPAEEVVEDQIGVPRTVMVPVDHILSEETEIPENIKEEIVKNAVDVNGVLMVEVEIENLGPNEEATESDNSEIVAEKIPGTIEEVSEEISEAIEELKINEPISSNNESDNIIEDEVYPDGEEE